MDGGFTNPPVLTQSEKRRVGKPVFR